MYTYTAFEKTNSSTTTHSKKDRRQQNWRRKHKKTLKRQRGKQKRSCVKRWPMCIYSSRVLDCLEKSNFGDIGLNKELQIDDGHVELLTPEKFCFSQSPEATISFLKTLYLLARNTKIHTVEIDYKNCKDLSVCAFTILDIILQELKKWRKSIRCPIEFLISSPRLTHTTTTSVYPSKNGFQDLLFSNLVSANYTNREGLELIKDGTSSDIAEKVIDYIDRSLHHQNLMLTDQGKNYFGLLLGEIADNCSQHGGANTTWYTSGHYFLDQDSHVGKCQLVIMDFGTTIYNGLKNSTTPKTRKQIDHYVKKSWRLFGPQESEETLYTLFSLQQRVSRINQHDIVRGNGTITFLNAFQQMFETNNRFAKSFLSITSGKCSILFDGTYSLQKKEYKTGYCNEVIAFNKNNNLSESPDKNYVRTLNTEFPGTVISVQLYIDDELLSRKDG